MSGTYIKIVRKWDLKGLQSDVVEAAEEGVEAAVQETTAWVKQDILLDQKYVGDADFPDVSAATRASKTKRGNRHVLVDTGHYKDSWIGESSGLKGVVHSGDEGYFGRLHIRWHIDKLWEKYHADEAMEIIKKAVTRKL